MFPLTPASFVVLAALVCLSCAGRAQGARVVAAQQAGEWKVEVLRTPVGDPRRHVVRCRFEVLRWAPRAAEPVVVYTDESARQCRVYLRHDGLCVVDAGGAPQLVFADGTCIAHPLCAAGSADSPSLAGGRVHFLGGAIVAVRSESDRMQILWFSVDASSRTATAPEVLLEVRGTGDWRQRIASAATPMEPMLQLGDVLMWVNRGAGGTDCWQHVPEAWRRRALRAFDVERREFVAAPFVPDASFRRHGEHILGFLEREAANRVVEFELWAIPRFGELRLVQFTDRLVRLLGDAKSAVADWDGNGDVSGRLRELRRVYARALLPLTGG